MTQKTRQRITMIAAILMIISMLGGSILSIVTLL